jgi:hypothetical protein
MGSLGVLENMMLLVRIEVRTSQGECRTLTLGELVKVGRMPTGRQVLDVQLDREAGTTLGLADGRSADALPLRVLQFTVTGLVAAWIAAPETSLTTASAEKGLMNP